MKRAGRATGSSPGWYRDPEDPTSMRHWNGRAWDGRRRNRPAWSLGTEELAVAAPGEAPLDGPVPAAAISGNRRASSRQPVRRHLLPNTSRAERHPPVVLVARAAGGRYSSRREWLLSRGPLAVALGLIAALVCILSMVARPPRLPSAHSPLAGHSAFLVAADSVCTASLGTAQSAAPATATLPASSAAAATTPVPAAATAPARTASSGGSGASAATQVVASNSALSRLAQRLGRLARSDGVGATVAGWLSHWVTFEQQRTLASRTESAAARSKADASAISAEAAADRFAQGNGLGACSLGSHSDGTVLVP